jgi:hypothetical protein
VATPNYLKRPTADIADADPGIAVPYGLTATAVVTAINDLYAYLHAINRASIDYGYDRLEDGMRAADFSGFLSELAVRAMARATDDEGASPGLRANRFKNGRPDLIPRGLYTGDAAQHGDEGIEVKASRYRAGWQGHNIERGQLMVVQFAIDVTTQPIYDRNPTTIERIMVAHLEEADWSYSGRSETSRRTITASVTKSGADKLRGASIYLLGRGAGDPVGTRKRPRAWSLTVAEGEEVRPSE